MKPILLNSADVRAILSNEKKRIILPIRACPILQDRGTSCIESRPAGDPWYKEYVWSMRRKDAGWQDYTEEKFLTLSPLGTPGGKVYVRETWCVADAEYSPMPDDGRPIVNGSWFWYAATDSIDYTRNRSPWRSPTNMPKAASRLILDVVAVRAARLNKVSYSEAIAFGLSHDRKGMSPGGSGYFHFEGEHRSSAPKDTFMSVWESRYKDTVFSCEKNPYVWIAEIRRSLPGAP